MPALTRLSARALQTLATAALVTIGPALGARAQGSIDFDNSLSTGRVAIWEPGNYYGGVYGVEVWELNGATAVPPGINGAPPLDAYATLMSPGFVLAATFADQNNSSTPGIIRLGELDTPAVAPAGAEVVIALAMWDSAAPTYSASIMGGGVAQLGVLAFLNPTADYTAVPRPMAPALSGWTSDLVMVEPVPEPSAFALAGAGAAALLLLRRRRN